MLEPIPATGASSEQLEALRARLGQLFTEPEPSSVVLGHGERRRAQRSAVDADSPADVELLAQQPAPRARSGDEVLLARIELLGEIVWFWTVNRKPRAAIVTYIHPDDQLDLAVLSPKGLEFQRGIGRGQCLGWTPRGSLT